MARKKREEEFEDDNVKAEGPRSFARFLELLADGEAHAELSKELHALATKLLEDAEATGQVAKGELMLLLRFKVEDNGISGVGYEIKVKEPDPRRSASVFWVNKGGNFVVENPRQQRLPLIDVSSRRDVARDVSDADYAESRSI